MNSLQIYSKLKMQPNFIGVYSCDLLPQNITKNKFGLVANTDDSKNQGEHWVAIFINNGKGEYFDSFGIPPLQENFINFLEKHCFSWKFNEQWLQNEKSSNCGLYAILFLIFRLNNISFQKFLKMFSTDTFVNEKVLEKTIKILNL